MPTQPPPNEPIKLPNPAKVTARMLQLRKLIAAGEFPDRDELAERIVEKLT